MIDRERIPCIHVLAGTNGAGKSSVGGAMFRESEPNILIRTKPLSGFTPRIPA